MLLGQNLLSPFNASNYKSPTPNRKQTLPLASGVSAPGELVLSYLSNNRDKVTIKKIHWALRRFPELKYHISALATFTSFTNQYPWVGKDVFGPGGISVTVDPKLNQDQALVDIVNQAFKVVQESGIKGDYLEKFTDIVKEASTPDSIAQNTESDIFLIKELIHKLFAHNDIYVKLYRAAKSIIIYSACVIDFSEDYSNIYIYGIDELEVETEDNRAGLGPSMNIPLSKDHRWYVKKTKKSLSDRAKIITDEDEVEDSPMGRIVHYLQILDALETSLSVERLVKSNSFIVWRVGADGLPGELVTPWLNVYKERVMTRLKAGTDNNDIVQASLSKSLTASHIFVPNYKDSPTEVDSHNIEYRPLLEDIEYWWSKVFMGLGIPPYYSTINKQANNINSDITSFHESLMGSRVRMYQALLEKILVFWSRQFIAGILGTEYNDKYNISVLLPTYVSGGEESRSEYMRRVNQFASAYSTLSVSGLPISPQFGVRLMFPNADPHEVIDWHTRQLMNPDSINPYNPESNSGGSTNNTEDQSYIDNMLNTIETGVLEPGQETTNTNIPELSLNGTPGDKEL